LASAAFASTGCVPGVKPTGTVFDMDDVKVCPGAIASVAGLKAVAQPDGSVEPSVRVELMQPRLSLFLTDNVYEVTAPDCMDGFGGVSVTVGATRVQGSAP